MADNPFAPLPTAAVAVNGAPRFTPSQVFVAAMLGGPVGGGWLMAENFRAVDDRAGVRNALLIAVGTLVVAAVFGFVVAALPSYVPSMAIAFGFRAWATQLEARSYGQPAGSVTPRGWRGAIGRGVGAFVLSLVGMMGVAAALALAIGVPE